MRGKRANFGFGENIRHYNRTETDEGLVIAAVRILVGSTSTDSTPRSLKVMGKSIEVKRGSKRWYAFHLTAQDIAFSLRNGFVSLEIGQAFDTTCSQIIDAIEVYAIKRETIRMLASFDAAIRCGYGRTL